MIFLLAIKSLRNIVCYLLRSCNVWLILLEGPLAVDGFVHLSELDENVHRDFRVGIQQIQLEQVSLYSLAYPSAAKACDRILPKAPLTR